MAGWLKLYRRLRDWEWYGVPNMVAVWVHILICACAEEKEWKGVKVPKGSLIFGREKMADEIGISVQQLRTCLSNLQKTGEITIKTTNKFSVLTVSKYDEYQAVYDVEQPAVQPTINQQPNQQITTSKEEKKKEYNISLQNAPACTRTEKPLEDWRFVSSVRRTILGNDKDRIAEYKKEVFSKEVYALAGKVGMSQQQQEAFISWWTERSPGNEKIKAEFEVAFDMESRMRSWVERDRPRYQQKTQKSRMDSLQDDMNFIHEFFNGKQQSNAAPDEQW